MSKKHRKYKKQIYSESIPTFLYTCDGGCKGDWVTPYEAEHMGWEFKYIPAIGRMIVRCPRCRCVDSYSKAIPNSIWAYVIEKSGKCSFREAIELQRNGVKFEIDGTKIEKSYQKIFLLDKHDVKIEDEEFTVENVRKMFIDEREEREASSYK